jgi:multimeric flavodoxin WrbA
MKVTIFTGSPNEDGLTAACGRAAEQAALEAGAEVLYINLNKMNIGKCNACGSGWGTCRDKHVCQVQDGFQKIHEAIADSDMFVAVTPVYWGEMSESSKAFFDRLRRCEALRRDESILENKPVLAIAAAGGSGNGTLTCLESMERLFKHVGAVIFDLIPITQKSRAYKIASIREGVKAMLLFKSKQQ